MGVVFVYERGINIDTKNKINVEIRKIMCKIDIVMIKIESWRKAKKWIFSMS